MKDLSDYETLYFYLDVMPRKVNEILKRDLENIKKLSEESRLKIVRLAFIIPFLLEYVDEEEIAYLVEISNTEADMLDLCSKNLEKQVIYNQTLLSKELRCETAAINLGYYRDLYLESLQNGILTSDYSVKLREMQKRETLKPKIDESEEIVKRLRKEIK